MDNIQIFSMDNRSRYTDLFLAPWELRQAVEMTAGHLDKFLPNWANHIDLVTLDLTSWGGCIMGQLAKQRFGVTSRGGRGLAEQFSKMVPSEAIRPLRVALNLGSLPPSSVRIIQMAWHDEVTRRLQVAVPETPETLESVSAEIEDKIAHDLVEGAEAYVASQSTYSSFLTTIGNF
jgi:hypothetical protein